MHNLHCLRPRLERKFNPEAYSSYTTSRPYYDIDRQDFYDDPDDIDSMGNQAFIVHSNLNLRAINTNSHTINLPQPKIEYFC